MFVSSLQLRDSQYHLFVQPALSFRCKELQIVFCQGSCCFLALVTPSDSSDQGSVAYVALIAACFHAFRAGHPGCPRKNLGDRAGTGWTGHSTRVSFSVAIKN